MGSVSAKQLVHELRQSWSKYLGWPLDGIYYGRPGSGSLLSFQGSHWLGTGCKLLMGLKILVLLAVVQNGLFKPSLFLIGCGSRRVFCRLF